MHRIQDHLRNSPCRPGLLLKRREHFESRDPVLGNDSFDEWMTKAFIGPSLMVIIKAGCKSLHIPLPDALYSGSTIYTV